MELRHVHTFLMLAEELHFGRAATRLRVAQSAVSQTLKSLEAEVGASLFERSRRAVKITPAGAAFLPHARAALDALSRASSEAGRVAEGTSGRLTLRFITMSVLTALPRAVVAFQRAYPEVRVDLARLSSVAQLEALRLGECDLGFVPKGAVSEGFESEMVEHDELVMLASARHPLAGRDEVSYREFARQPMILLRREDEPALRAHLRRDFEAVGAQQNVVLEVDQIETLLAFIAADLGVSLVPGFVRRLQHDGVVAVPLRPSKRVGISAVWLKGALSPAARRFLDVLRAERDRGVPDRP